MEQKSCLENFLKWSSVGRVLVLCALGYNRPAALDPSFLIRSLRCLSVHKLNNSMLKSISQHNAHIRRQQFFTVIDAGHRDLSLAHEGKVEGIGWDQKQVYETREPFSISGTTCSGVFFNVTDWEDENNNLRTYQLVLASCLTWFGKKYDSFSHWITEMSLWIFLRDLR